MNTIDVANTEHPRTCGEDPPEPAGKGHSFVALDLIRGLAALEVFLFHARGSLFPPYGSLDAQSQTAAVAAFFTLTRFGRESVLVFFVLSGFLVGGSVLTQLRDKRFDLHKYVVDRATRVFLPLIPAVVLAFVVSTFVMHQHIPLAFWMAHLSALNEIAVPTVTIINPLWSLTYEIWFYILAGAIAHLVSKRSPLAVVVIMITAIAFSILQSRYLLFWCLGAVMSHFLLSFRSYWVALASTLAITAGSALVELGLKAEAAQLSPMNYPPTLERAGEALICIGFSLLLPSLCSPSLNKSAAPLVGVAAAMGGISYSLYLFHYPLLNLLANLFPRSTHVDASSLLQYVISTSLTFIAVVALYFAFERNTSALRKFLLRRHSTAINCRAASSRTR